MKKLILFTAFTGLILSTNAQDTIATGTCGVNYGNNLTWVLTKDSVLTISGSGDMHDSDPDYQPWGAYRNHIAVAVIENGVKTIGDMAFYGCINLTSVSISNSVITIKELAFYGCANLPSVSIPNSVITIESRAFVGCINLVSINVGTNNSVYSSIDGIVYNKLQNILIYCPEGKTAVNIPNSVITIGNRAFTRSKLTSIDIPNTVTTIEDWAFFSSINLTTINIPSSVTVIGKENVFSACSTLRSIDVDVNNLIYSSIDGILYNKLQDTLIRCPMGKTDTTVIIPNSVTTIGENAFMNCINLISINIPDSVVTISRFAFFYCENLASVIIPSSVSTIKYGAFYACGSLASITIPNSVTMIEEAAFYACGSLASITIPNSVTTIGEAAFYDCHSLSSITIPNSLTTIEAWTFSSCQNLTSVIIPKSVTKIKSYAFTCIRLDTIICKAKYPPSLDQDVFWGVPQTALVYIPCGTTWYYEMNWVFTNYIEMGITPATPTNINIAEVGSGFVLTWQGETDSYNLYRDYQFLAAVSTNTYTDTDLISGVNYCYRVQSVVSEDCESELSEEVCKKSGVGILEAQSIASLQTIFPNPARSQFTVTHTENASLQLYNMVGQEVLHTQSTNENTIINVSTLPQGLYMLKVVKDGTVKMYKVVVSG